MIERPAPLVVGHRGASAFAPENSFAAFERALADGADGLEFDVRLASDGVPVVIHDADLRRTGGRNVAVASLSSAALAEVSVGEWFNRRFPARSRAEFAQERVPALAEVCERFAPRCAALYVELKFDGANARADNAAGSHPRVREDVRALAAATVNVLRDSPENARRAVVESFTLEAVAEVRRLAPELRTAALFERTLTRPHPRAADIIARALDCGADEVALHRSLVSPPTVAAAHDAGLRVAVWTADHPAWATRARALGLRALITNSPARQRAALDAARREP
jgi:glycerophosphoryl diester phosphodiesterase